MNMRRSYADEVACVFAVKSRAFSRRAMSSWCPMTWSHFN